MEQKAAKARLVGRVVTNIYDDAFRPFGVKVSQLNILVVTQHLGVARPAAIDVGEIEVMLGARVVWGTEPTVNPSV